MGSWAGRGVLPSPGRPHWQQLHKHCLACMRKYKLHGCVPAGRNRSEMALASAAMRSMRSRSMQFVALTCMSGCVTYPHDTATADNGTGRAGNGTAACTPATALKHTVRQVAKTRHAPLNAHRYTGNKTKSYVQWWRCVRATKRASNLTTIHVPVVGKGTQDGRAHKPTNVLGRHVRLNEHTSGGTSEANRGRPTTGIVSATKLRAHPASAPASTSSQASQITQ